MNPKLLQAIFYWILPLSVALGAFFLFMSLSRESFERADVDRIWKLILKIGVGLGIIALFYVILSNIPFIKQAISFVQTWSIKLLKFDFIGKTENKILQVWRQTVQFFIYWIPIYIRAFILVWVPAALIGLQSLIWRIKFSRGANIICRVILLYPYLCFKYFLGYETPFFDYVMTKLYIAKIKENISDSFFEALQGRDETGKAFDNGQGGTERNQKIKAAALSIRQARAEVKTANGVRHAQLIIRNSRETATDQVIEQQLKGLGLRL